MTQIVVAKFGGSSLANGEQFVKVKKIVNSDIKRRFIVPSAPGKRNNGDRKVTDLLYLCYEKANQGLDVDEIFSIIRKRYEEICEFLDLNIDIEVELDGILNNIKNGASRDYTGSRGEYLNGIILSRYLGYDFIDSKDLIIFNKNGVFDPIATEERIGKRLEGVDYAVIPGYYGAKENGDIVTFSRGGSDFTGAILANGVKASLYENWTDVSGLLMADPRIVSDAKTIEIITYKELRELSYMGAPVLHEEVIFPVKKYGIPINLRNTNIPKHKGTMILDESTKPPIIDAITGISGKKDFTVITIEKAFMNSEIGFIRKLSEVFENNKVSIEHIPSSIDGMSVIVSSLELDSKLDKIIRDIRTTCEIDNIVIRPNVALIAVVGRGLSRSKDILARIFIALQKQEIDINMISQDSSELNIILGVNSCDYEKAVEAIYRSIVIQ